MKLLRTLFLKSTKLFFVILTFFNSAAFSQVYGCKDSFANNYNSQATINDGSCTYDETLYFPPVLVNPINAILNESSGLQWVNNSLWSFNDGGGAASIYRIDTASNAILQTVQLAGATNVDWEEAAYDGTYFYVGDFGNNQNGARNNLKIYKFPYSAIPDYATNAQATIPAGQIEIINFTYSDQQPQPPVAVASNTTPFDCEAMIVDKGQIHLFTKNWSNLTSTHYVISGIVADNYVASPVDTLTTGYLVTGADKAPGQNVIILLGYQVSGFGNHFMHLLSDYSNGKYFNGNKRKISLPNALEMGQAEGITFKNDTSGYISNEKVSSINQKLRYFNTGGFIPSYVLADELKNFSVSKLNGTNKISWKFHLPVYLEVQKSLDGMRFTSIKTYNTSAAGSLYYKPEQTLNYYRLAWRRNNGEYQYSKIISVKNEENNLISNLAIRATGELSFTLSGNQSQRFAFKLLSTDGKTISQATEHTIRPGFNKINFNNDSALNGIVLVNIANDNQKITKILKVIK